MSTLHYPSGLPSPSSSTATHRPTAHPGPKLRDSCHSCASSKVKCNKEKPTCSRCAKRGITCEYVATKRAGRKHDNSSSNRDARSNSGSTSTLTAATSSATQPVPSPTSWDLSISVTTATDSMSSPGITHASPAHTTLNVSSALFPTLLSPLDRPLLGAVSGITPDLDDLFASPGAFSALGGSDTDILGQAHLFATGLDSSANGPAALLDFPTFGDAASELSTSPNPTSSVHNCTTSTSDNQSSQDFCASDSSRPCLVRALGLMKQLFPNISTPCTTSTSRGLDTPATTPPTIQKVIAENEHTVEAVGAMLQCSCSQDGYLLAIMSLIVFKVLGWYAAAARTAPSLTDDDSWSHSLGSSTNTRRHSHSEQVLKSPAVVGSYCLDGEDSARMAAQLVLSELHRVQRLVNQLSTRLKEQAAKSARRPGTTSHSAAFEHADAAPISPFSAAMLEQLGVDLASRLRALSSEIVEGLRRE